MAAKPYATDIFQSIFNCFVPVDLKKKHETALESHQRVEISKSHLQKFHFQSQERISKFESRELLKIGDQFFVGKVPFPKFHHFIGIALKWSADSRQALDHLVLILPALNMALSCEVAETRCSEKAVFRFFCIWILLGIFTFKSMDLCHDHKLRDAFGFSKR